MLVELCLTYRARQSRRRLSCFTGAHIGAIAQLVERLNGIQEVRGSTPLGSTFTEVTKIGRAAIAMYRDSYESATQKITDAPSEIFCGPIMVSNWWIPSVCTVWRMYSFTLARRSLPDGAQSPTIQALVYKIPLARSVFQNPHTEAP